MIEVINAVGDVCRFNETERLIRDRRDLKRLRLLRKYKFGLCRNCDKWIRVYNQTNWDGFCLARCERSWSEYITKWDFNVESEAEMLRAGWGS
ncbi:hypothetical protein ES707_22398 [subsurface metagenome]